MARHRTRGLVISELLRKSANCVLPNWGRKQELPVKPELVSAAWAVLLGLDQLIDCPSIRVERDGTISFVWHVGRGNRCMIATLKTPEEFVLHGNGPLGRVAPTLHSLIDGTIPLPLQLHIKGFLWAARLIVKPPRAK